MTALCRGSANSAMGQVGSTMGRGLHSPGLSGPAGTAGSAPRRRSVRLTAAPWSHGRCGGPVRGGESPSGPDGLNPGWRSLPTSGRGLCPPPRPHCFPRLRRRHLKLFSGPSEEGGAPAGDPGVRADGQESRPIRGGRAGRSRGGASRTAARTSCGAGLKGTGPRGAGHSGRASARRDAQGSVLEAARRPSATGPSGCAETAGGAGYRCIQQTSLLNASQFPLAQAATHSHCQLSSF